MRVDGTIGPIAGAVVGAAAATAAHGNWTLALLAVVTAGFCWRLGADVADAVQVVRQRCRWLEEPVPLERVAFWLAMAGTLAIGGAVALPPLGSGLALLSMVLLARAGAAALSPPEEILPLAGQGALSLQLRSNGSLDLRRRARTVRRLPATAGIRLFGRDLEVVLELIPRRRGTRAAPPSGVRRGPGLRRMRWMARRGTRRVPGGRPHRRSHPASRADDPGPTPTPHRVESALRCDSIAGPNER